jgi:hypothetical protein
VPTTDFFSFLGSWRLFRYVHRNSALLGAKIGLRLFGKNLSIQGMEVVCCKVVLHVRYGLLGPAQKHLAGDLLYHCADFRMLTQIPLAVDALFDDLITQLFFLSGGEGRRRRCHQ